MRMSLRTMRPSSVTSSNAGRKGCSLSVLLVTWYVMYQYARGALVCASCTTTRCGLPWTNSSSQLLGYGLGLGNSARADDGVIAAMSRATTIRQEVRRIGELLRVG